MRAANGDVRVKAGGKGLPPPEISAMILRSCRSRRRRSISASRSRNSSRCLRKLATRSARRPRTPARLPASRSRASSMNRRRRRSPMASTEEGRDDRCRLRRRHVRHLDSRSGRGRGRSQGANGDTHLSGDNLDQRIIEWIIAEFKKDEGIDLGKDRMALQRLKESAEKAKMELSTVTETEINLPFIGGRDRSEAHGQEAHARQVRAVGRRPAAAHRRSDQAGARRRGRGFIEDRRSRARRRLDAYPARPADRQGSLRERTHKGVNPDEVVAIGAAVQAGVLAGEVKDLLLLDVTPLSLGIETLGGVMTTLIQRNTTIPTKKSETFSTAADNQTSVEVHVLQGERPMARDNRTLGKFHLSGLPAAPPRMPRSRSLSTSTPTASSTSRRPTRRPARSKITITASSSLNNGRSRPDDARGRVARRRGQEAQEEIETRNQADQAAYAAERMVKDAGDKLPAADRQPIESAIEELKKAIEKNVSTR